MADISFPAYGKLMTGQMSERPIPIVERTEMESGPQKQRRKQSRTMVERDITYIFSAAEYATFKTWFYTTSLYGSKFFNWTDPVTSTTKDARIVGGAIEAAPINPKLSAWRVSFVLETYSS